MNRKLKEAKRKQQSKEAEELRNEEQNDPVLTGKEMMTIKSTTVNSIILKDSIEQQLLVTAPSLEVKVDSIYDIQSLRYQRSGIRNIS